MSKSTKSPIVLEHSKVGLWLELRTFSPTQLVNLAIKADHFNVLFIKVMSILLATFQAGELTRTCARWF